MEKEEKKNGRWERFEKYLLRGVAAVAGVGVTFNAPLGDVDDQTQLIRSLRADVNTIQFEHSLIKARQETIYRRVQKLEDESMTHQDVLDLLKNPRRRPPFR